jgi:transposase
VARAQVAGLSWPLPAELTDDELERLLYRERGSRAGRPEPDYKHIHQELRRKGVTLQLLWQEYRAVHPDGLEYSAFCDRYRRWRQGLDVVMRQSHAPGEKLFVDYAGVTVPITDPQTGEVTQASVFVAAFGASNYTYAEVVRGEDLKSWVGAHIRALEHFGGECLSLERVIDFRRNGRSDCVECATAPQQAPGPLGRVWAALPTVSR